MATITTNITVLHTSDYQTAYGVETIACMFYPADTGFIAGQGITPTTYWGVIGSPANHGAGIFTDIYDLANYYFSAAAPQVVAKMNTVAANNGTSDTYVAGNLIFVDDLTNNAIMQVAPKAYEGTTLRTAPFAIFKDASVSSGTAVFHLTNDGTSTGTALFSNGIIQDSINLIVNDATAPYQISWALSNSNKTLTATVNKSVATVISLLGLSLLAAPSAAPNGTTVRLSVWGY